MRVVVGGATGKLGGLVARLITEREDMELVGAVVSPDSDRLGTELFPGIEAASPHDLTSLLSGADVYVDLTSPSAAESNLPSVPEGGVNAVVGTTGISEETMQTFSQGISEKGLSAVVSPNFSVGVNLLWGLCDLLSRVLKDYDVEIIETHHNQKRDAPSGTAARAARIISEGAGIERMVHGRQGETGTRGREIGVHAVRAGDVVGEHTVMFAGNKERLEITHRAHSREAFAEGCLTAIEWVSPLKDGLIHNMDEVLGLK